MANIMDVFKLRNNPTRDGFDLSFKNNFTAKVGELLPCFCKPVFPGDKFQINPKTFTRLQPVNTAAFARMREYYDFYFVPMDILWNKFNSVITQMYNNLQRASGPLLSDNISPNGDLPYITCEQIATYVHNLRGLVGSYHGNIFGMSRASLTCKLLSYLGYGDYTPYLQDDVTWQTHPMPYNLELSVLPLLAYQHVYADFFRHTQWEKTNPSTFNVDYIKGTNDTNLSIQSAQFTQDFNFLDLRYSNYNKDLIFGVQPNAQYGSESTVDFSSDFTNLYWRVNGSDVAPNGTASFSPSVNNYPYSYIHDGSGNSVLPVSSLTRFSILALRQAQMLQKWKEISQSVSEDYKAQLEAHWGVKVSNYLSDCSRYLGGTATSLDINPVVNQNITGNNGADIAGIGTFVNNSGYIEFESKAEYGYIIGVYHVTPIFDYSCGGIDPILTDTHVLDFPIPEFDRIGMEQVPSYVLSNTPNLDANSEIVNKFVTRNSLLGYAPRYVRHKTSLDVARGAFTTSLKSWVLPYNLDTMSFLKDLAIGHSAENPVSDNNPARTTMTWSFFKVNPHVVDTLFAVDADDTYDTDQMLVSAYFDAKVVRNLDAKGLPY